MFKVTVEDNFSAAHRLKEYDGNCEKLHGHNWRVQVSFKTENLNKLGLAIDFRDAKQRVKKALMDLDHALLNDLKEFSETNPTCENIARVIYKRLQSTLSAQLNPDVSLSDVTVWESQFCSVTYFEGS